MRSCVFLQDKLVDLVPTIIGKLADKLMIVCKVCRYSIEQDHLQNFFKGGRLDFHEVTGFMLMLRYLVKIMNFS